MARPLRPIHPPHVRMAHGAKRRRRRGHATRQRAAGPSTSTNRSARRAREHAGQHAMPACHDPWDHNAPPAIPGGATDRSKSWRSASLHLLELRLSDLVCEGAPPLLELLGVQSLPRATAPVRSGGGAPTEGIAELGQSEPLLYHTHALRGASRPRNRRNGAPCGAPESRLAPREAASQRKGCPRRRNTVAAIAAQPLRAGPGFRAGLRNDGRHAHRQEGEGPPERRNEAQALGRQAHSRENAVPYCARNPSTHFQLLRRTTRPGARIARAPGSGRLACKAGAPRTRASAKVRPHLAQIARPTGLTHHVVVPRPHPDPSWRTSVLRRNPQHWPGPRWERSPAENTPRRGPEMPSARLTHSNRGIPRAIDETDNSYRSGAASNNT